MAGQAIQAAVDEYVRNIALDDEVSLAAIYSQTAGHAVARQIESRALRSAGVSANAFRLLFLLRIIGPAERDELAGAMFLSPNKIADLIATLRADGFVASDRGMFVRLSPAGIRLTNDFFAALQEGQAAAMSAFTRDELRTYLALTQKLVAAARKHTPGG